MDLKKIGDLLENLDLEKRKKYIKKEFQAYGLALAEELGDWKNRSLYIKLAKQFPREWLQQAHEFVKDQSPDRIKNKAALFMWKFKKIKNEKYKKEKNKTSQSRSSRSHQS